MGDYISPVLTKFTIEQLVTALYHGWYLAFGEYPKSSQLGVLYAQIILEVGAVTNPKFQCICNNLGNLKKSANINWTMYRCGEIINGAEVFFDPPHPETHFQAYKSLDSGVKGYIDFISKKPRYKKAWQQVVKGNPSSYSRELKVAGYYTANEALYTKGVVALYKQFGGMFAKLDINPKAVVSEHKNITEAEINFDISEIQIIPFDWNKPDDWKHELRVDSKNEHLGPLEVEGVFNKIFAFILQLISNFTKK